MITLKQQLALRRKALEVRVGKPEDWTLCPFCGRQITRLWFENYGGCSAHRQFDLRRHPNCLVWRCPGC